MSRRSTRATIRATAAPSALVLVGIATWAGATGALGDPARATTLLVLAGGLAGIAHAVVRRQKRTLARVRPRWVSPLALALLPWVPPASVALARALPLPTIAAEILLVLLWAVAIAAGLRALARESGSGSAPSVALATAAVAGAGALLAAGLPPIVLSAAGAGLLGSGAVEAADRAEPGVDGDAMRASLLAIIGVAWLLTLPPLVAAFAGPLPHATPILITGLLLGWTAGRALWPGHWSPGWVAPATAGGSAVLGLLLLGRFPAMVPLASSPDLRGLGPLVPWLMMGLATAACVGFGASRGGLSSLWRRPGWAGTGTLVAATIVAVAQGRGHIDLPLRLAAGLAVVGTMAHLIARPARERWLGQALGWAAVAGLIACVSLMRPLDPGPAALAILERALAHDGDARARLVGARVLGSGADRAGPHAVVEDPMGRHVLRSWQALGPAESEAAAETMAALLPALAASEPRSATVIGLGRGIVLEPLAAMNIREINLMDRSRHAASQLSSLGDPLPELLADPAARLHRAHPMPVLPSSVRDQDVVVVDLPPVHVPGAQAWYGEGFARAISRRVSPTGWASFRMSTWQMTAEDVAAAVVAFGNAFPAASVWVDPSGNGDVILLGNPRGARPDAGIIARGLQRRSLRDSLRGQDVSDIDDLFARAFSRADAALFHERARDPRGLSWRGASAWMRQRRALPLADLAAAARPLEEIVDLTSLPAVERERLTQPAMPAEEFWPVYLRFLDMTSQGMAVDAMAFAEQLRLDSDDPTRDLAPLIQQTVDAGRLAAARGQEDDAYALYLLATSFAPDDVDANVELGRLAWSQDNLGEAIQRFDTALEREPDNLVALLGAADARIRLGRTDEAHELLGRAVDAHPTSVDAMYNLGRLQSDLGRYEEGVAQLRRAQPFDPADARIPFAIAEALFLNGLQTRDRDEPHAVLLDQARHAALHALSLERAPRGLCLYGQIETQRGEFSVAEEALEEALATAPDDFDVRASLGEAYFAQHEFESAARQFQAAEALQPGDERVAHRLMQLRALAPREFD